MSLSSFFFKIKSACSTPKFVSTVKVKVILSPEDTKVGEIAVTVDVNASFVTRTLTSCFVSSI